MAKLIKNTLCGYTLIELIIVIAIISLFSTLGLAQYNSYSEQARLKTEAQKLSGVLELARKKALAQDLGPSCTANEFQGYQVKLGSTSDGTSSDTNKYLLSLCCSGTCSESASNRIQSYAFPNTNIVFGSAVVGTTGESFPYPVQFYPSQAYSSLSSTLTLMLKNSAITSTNKCIKITVSTIGVVWVDDQFSSC